MVPLVPSGHKFAVHTVYHQEYKGRVIFAGDMSSGEDGQAVSVRGPSVVEGAV